MNITMTDICFITDNKLLITTFLLLAISLCFYLEFYSWYLLVLILSFLIAYCITEPMYFFVFTLGMLTAFAEIIGKFRDEPIKTLRSGYAVCYHVFNGLIAVFALKLLILNGVKSEADLDKIKIVLIAGLGSMLIMRSKLFNIKVGDDEVAVGPDQIMTVFLNFMNSSINRVRSLTRMRFVTEKLQDIDFDKVYVHCKVVIDSSQINENDLKKVKDKIDALVGDDKYTKQQKSYLLGFFLLNEMGEDFVSAIFDKSPLEWKYRAPPPEESLLNNVTNFFQSNEILCMAYSSIMSSQELRMKLGWEDMEETKLRQRINPIICELKGYKLVFNKPIENDSTYGHANLVKDENGLVEGVIYHLTKEALAFLDRMEVGYIRKEFTVTTREEKKEVKVQVYLAESSRDGLKPSKDYLDKILEGAREHQLNLEYIAKIRDIDS